MQNHRLDTTPLFRHISAPLFEESSFMTATPTRSYDPRTFKALTFHDIVPRFRNNADTPRAYLERCLETLRHANRWCGLSCVERGKARTAADASSTRWKAGKPLSAIDGMPIAIKDLLETKDMPTEMGCEAYRGNVTNRDNAAVWALRQAGAVILGKTVTAELGGTHPGPTTNPFDPACTPGGSSSGTAAIAAHMAPQDSARRSAAPSFALRRTRQCRVETNTGRHQSR
jgi:Asp-tRNA(Asn)/Glu-tRNA(Gln) amidotransferase A subunit family amidase